MKIIDFDIGDRIYVKYRYSKYYGKTGTITHINYNGINHGDCIIKLDFSDLTDIFYYTNLEKIVHITEYPSGEVLYVSYKDAINLVAIGSITYNYDKGYYYFSSTNKYKIEEYVI